MSRPGGPPPSAPRRGPSRWAIPLALMGALVALSPVGYAVYTAVTLAHRFPLAADRAAAVADTPSARPTTPETPTAPRATPETTPEMEIPGPPAHRPEPAAAPPPRASYQGVDVCALVTPAEADRVVDRRTYDSGSMAVRARTVRVADGVPVDTCVYGTDPSSVDPVELAGLEVSVSAIPRRPDRIDGFALDSEPVPGLADEAYLVPGDLFTRLLVRRGDSQIIVEAVANTVTGPRSRATREALLDLMRTAVARLPAEVVVAGDVADTSCARIRAATLEAALTQPVAMSRRYRDDNSLVCSYSASHDAQVLVMVERRPSRSRLEFVEFSIRESVDKVRQPGLDGAWAFGEISAVDGRAILTVRVDGIDGMRADDGPSAEELALAREAARVLLT